MTERRNPYSVTEASDLPPEQDSPGTSSTRLRSSVLAGVAVSIASAFPIAMLLVSVYRFPIPLAGYQSGSAAIPAAVIAVLVYGTALGGFLPLALIGGASGWFAHRRFEDSSRRRRCLVSLAMLGTLALLMILANLDYLIGPW